MSQNKYIHMSQKVAKTSIAISPLPWIHVNNKTQQTAKNIIEFVESTLHYALN